MMTLDNLALSTHANGHYREIQLELPKSYVQHYPTVQVGDLCAAQFILGGSIERAMADRLVACWNAFKGMSLEEIATLTATLQGTLSPSQQARRLLTDGQVREIRSRAALGESHRALGAEYGVKRSAISRIVRFETYKEVR